VKTDAALATTQAWIFLEQVMDIQLEHRKDHVRENSPREANFKIDDKTRESIRQCAAGGPQAIRKRMAELDEEWDIERTLELNAALIALSGVVLGATVDKRWLILPAVVTAFLAQHAIQGWCPPLPLFRQLGVRTQKEIAAEREALNDLLEENYSGNRRRR
jgi:hypothetical protein